MPTTCQNKHVHKSNILRKLWAPEKNSRVSGSLSTNLDHNIFLDIVAGSRSFHFCVAFDILIDCLRVLVIHETLTQAKFVTFVLHETAN